MDFRLKVFHSVACNLSFTKASRELFISQPAISKHIHELEVQYKTPLFERTGSQIRLTRAGELLFSHTHSLLASYRQLDFEMNLLTNNFLGDLHLGASTTISQYVLPPVLALFIKMFPDIHVSVLNGNRPGYRVGFARWKNNVRIGGRDYPSKYDALYTFYEG